jgi:hypothetical protein
VFSGVRVLNTFFLWTIVPALDFAALVMGGAPTSGLIGLVGFLWLTLLRGRRQHLSFSQDGVEHRRTWTVRNFAANDLAGGWFENSGGRVILSFRRGSCLAIDLGDLRFDKDALAHRWEVLAALMDNVHAPYVAHMSVAAPEANPCKAPAGRKESRPTFVPLVPSEWAVVLVTAALVIYHVVPSGG